MTDTNPEGLTSVTGKWAADFAQRLHSSDLTCHVLERKEWEIKMVRCETPYFCCHFNIFLMVYVADFPWVCVQFHSHQLEKHIWICAFMAIGAKYRCTVGEVEKQYDESVRMMINELARTATKVSVISFYFGCFVVRLHDKFK